METRVQRYAVIDIGSNSTRMMLCESDSRGNLRRLAKELIPTRLSQGIVQSGNMSDEAMARTLEAVNTLRERAVQGGAQQVFAFATAAVREAGNRDYFIQDVHKRTTLLIDVLSPEDEARIGFLGTLAPGARAVIDIGGASTEIGIGVGARLDFTRSFKLGAVRASEKYPLGDIADELSLQAMQQWVYNTITAEGSQLADALKSGGVDTVSGVGGTITALASMDQRLESYDPALIQGYTLGRVAINGMIHSLCELPLEKRRLIPGLASERADIIIGGAVILQQAMRCMDITKITVSDRDNLEGYLHHKLFHAEDTDD